MLIIQYLWAVAVFAAGELIAVLLFTLIKKAVGPKESGVSTLISIAKGALERLVVFTGLLYGYPQVLIAFGAIKIATRLSTDQQQEISNNYFLIGNLVSIFLALVYTIITREIWSAQDSVERESRGTYGRIYMQIVLYIAASVDGYIAGPNGEIGWLSMVDQEGEDYGYDEFYESVDAIVSGSKTYELAASFGEWPYPGKPTFVFTRRPLRSERDDVFFLSEEVDSAMEKLKAQGFQRVWLLGGGELVRSFLQHRLIDEYIVSTIPIILGEGIRLFPPPSPEQKLGLISYRQYESGLVQVHYRNNKNP